jgi:hypothetical protein
MRYNGVGKFILFIILVQTILIFNNSHYYYGIDSSNSQKEQYSIHNLKISDSLEYDQLSGVINNTSIINIDMPDLTWNITEIKLNFTGINQFRQLRTVEGNISVSY